jgi:hypothetical protein
VVRLTLITTFAHCKSYYSFALQSPTTNINPQDQCIIFHPQETSSPNFPRRRQVSTASPCRRPQRPHPHPIQSHKTLPWLHPQPRPHVAAQPTRPVALHRTMTQCPAHQVATVNQTAALHRCPVHPITTNHCPEHPIALHHSPVRAQHAHRAAHSYPVNPTHR